MEKGTLLNRKGSFQCNKKPLVVLTDNSGLVQLQRVSRVFDFDLLFNSKITVVVAYFNNITLYLQIIEGKEPSLVILQFCKFKNGSV